MFFFRYDASSRNVFRYPDLKEDIEIRKVKDHFIFTVESVGAVPPEELVRKTNFILFLNPLESAEYDRLRPDQK